MATRQDLDNAIATLGTTITTGLADLQAKITAGQVQTPEDFSSEISSLQAMVANVVQADPNANASSAPASPAPTSTTTTASS